MQEYCVYISNDEGYIEMSTVWARCPEDAYQFVLEGEGELVDSFPDTVGKLAWVENELGKRFEM